MYIQLVIEQNILPQLQFGNRSKGYQEMVQQVQESADASDPECGDKEDREEEKIVSSINPD